MSIFAKPAALWVLPLAVMALAMVVIAADPAGLPTRLRGYQFDTYQRLHPRPYRETQGPTGYAVKVLDVSDAPAGLDRWPLPRGVLARLVSGLQAAGADVIVLDTPLDSHDPLSPEAFAQGVAATPDNAALREALAKLPSRDAELARALAAIHAVTAVRLTTAPGGRFIPKPRMNLDGPAATLDPVPDFAGAAAPVPGLFRASSAVGASNLPADPDGVLRAVPMVLRLNGAPVPSLDAAVLHLTGGEALSLATEDESMGGLRDRARLSRLSAGALTVPIRAGGAMAVWFSGPNPARLVSAQAALAGHLTPGSLAHSIIYLAPPVPRLVTPNGPETAGEIHAEAMENLLLATPLRQADSGIGELVFLFFAGIGLSVIAARFGLRWAALFAVVIVALAQGFTWFLFVRNHVLFDSANASLGLLAGLGAAAGMRLVQVAAGRSALRTAFAGALNKAALDRLARNPALLKTGGETRMVTCLSCGIRGYSALAEAFGGDAAGFNRLIGTLMSPLVQAATDHGAMVDCLTAGSFNAYWNAPLEDSEHAIHACEAASRMTVALAEVNEQLSRERRIDGTAYEPVEIGIGLATGKAAAGAFSLAGRMHYAVNGECTVIAEAIRQQSGRYGPAIIAADDTRLAASRGFAFLEVDFVALDAGSEPMKLFALLGNPVVRASPKFRALATFHDHIFQSLRTQQWDKARELIDQCRKLSGASQKLYDLQLARIAWFEAHPPGAEWDGAFRVAVP